MDVQTVSSLEGTGLEVGWNEGADARDLGGDGGGSSGLGNGGGGNGGGCGCPPDCDIPNIDDLDIEVGTIINTSSFKINVPHMNFWTGEYDSVSIDTDGDGLADSLLFPNSDSTNTNGSSDLKKESFIVQQILRLAFGSTVGQLFSSQGLSNGGNNYNYMQNTILGLPSDATQQQKDSVNLVRLGENYHNSLRKD